MAYVELFGGGASILLNKARSHFELLNDSDSDLINLYRCVRESSSELTDAMTFVLNARDEFKAAQQRLKDKNYKDNIQRAVDFYQVIVQSYGGKGSTFGANPRGVWGRFPHIYTVAGRLQGVVLENQDFERIILARDSEDTFFYADPPYFMTEDYYLGGNFGREDHERLANVLLGAHGLWLLSYNDCPEIISLYSKPGIYIERFTRLSNLAQKYEAGKKYPELLISNYDTSNPSDGQIMLAGAFPLERNYICKS